MAKERRGGKTVYVRASGYTKWDAESEKSTKNSDTKIDFGTKRKFTGENIKTYYFSGQTIRGNYVRSVEIRASSYEEASRLAKLRGLRVGKNSLREKK